VKIKHRNVYVHYIIIAGFDRIRAVTEKYFLLGFDYCNLANSCLRSLNRLRRIPEDSNTYNNCFLLDNGFNTSQEVFEEEQASYFFPEILVYCVLH
jgi:hypothetical protein